MGWTQKAPAAGSRAVMTKRLLFVNHYPAFGGPHNRALRLAGPLREQGWETTVLLPDEAGNAADRFRTAGVPVIVKPLKRIRITKNLRTHRDYALSMVPDVRRIRQVIREENIDLVITVGLENPHGAIAAKLENVALICQVVGTLLPMTVRRLLMMPTVRMADVLMTTGTTVAELYPGSKKMGKRLVPFFSPVDIELFAPDTTHRQAARAELGVSETDEVIGNVSNLVPQKDLLTFVRAAAKVKEARPNAKFVMLGAIQPTHTKYANEVMGLARELGLKEGEDLIITYPGPRVAELASAFDIFWMTAQPLGEGVPTVVMEAMALELPVVATDVAGVRDAVTHGEDGLLVEAHDDLAMAKVTCELLSDDEQRNRVAQNARATAVRRFAKERCLETHLLAFQLALQHHS